MRSGVTRGAPATHAVLETSGRLVVDTAPTQSNERIPRLRIDPSGEHLPQTRGLVRGMHSAHRGMPLRPEELSAAGIRLDPSWRLHNCDRRQSTRAGWVGSMNWKRLLNARVALPHDSIPWRRGWNRENPDTRMLPHGLDDPKGLASCVDGWPQPCPHRSGKQPWTA